MNQKVVELKNLTDRDFNFTYAGMQYEIPADGTISVLEEVAYHARKKSIKSYDLETGRAQYQVGIDGIHDLTSIGAGKKPDEELIDRKTDEDGDKAATINVRGGKIVTDSESAI